MQRGAAAMIGGDKDGYATNDVNGLYQKTKVRIKNAKKKLFIFGLGYVGEKVARSLKVRVYYYQLKLYCSLN